MLCKPKTSPGQGKQGQRAESMDRARDVKKGRRLGLGLGAAWSCPDTFTWAFHLSESVSSRWKAKMAIMSPSEVLPERREMT